MATKRLFLLRHARASHEFGEGTDADRPLAERGQQDALLAGEWLSKHYPEDVHVYASSSKRTRETYLGLSESVQYDVQFEEGLYLASQGELLHGIQELPEAQEHVMILGHNPGLHQLAMTLSDTSTIPAEHRDALIDYPTCALLVLQFENTVWRDIQLQTGKWEAYWCPHSAELN